MITRESVDTGIFQDAMKLIARHDFREAKPSLRVEFVNLGKYDTPQTRFTLILEGATEPPMLKAILELFPDTRFYSEKSTRNPWGQETCTYFQLKRPTPKEDATT